MRNYFIFLFLVFFSTEVAALTDWDEYSGYLRCKNTYEPNAQIKRWHSSISRVNVYLNWNSFLTWGINAGERMRVQASAAYAVRQWSNNFPKKPMYLFVGETTRTEPAFGELIIEMQEDPGDYSSQGMAAFGNSYEVCPSSLKSCDQCDGWPFDLCNYYSERRVGECQGPGGDEPGTFYAAKVVLFKYFDADKTSLGNWRTELVDSTGGLPAQNIAPAILHEIGHTLGLSHTCNVTSPPYEGSLNHSCPTYSLSDIYQGAMSSGTNGFNFRRKWAYGPHAVEVRLLNNLYTYLSAYRPHHYVSYDNGSTWAVQTSSVDNITSHVSVGYGANGSSTEGVLAIQYQHGSNRVYTLRTNGTNYNNVENPSGVRSQLGPSVATARDRTMTTMSTAVLFPFKTSTDVDTEDFSKWLDMIYSPAGGSTGSWYYQMGFQKTFTRPSVSYVKSGINYYFVVAFLDRSDTPRMRIHIAADNYRSNPPSTPNYCSLSTLYIPGTSLSPTPYGDVSIGCAPPETGLNTCLVSYVEDGRTFSGYQFRPMYIFGHINSNCTWTSDSYGAFQEFHSSGGVTGLFQSSTNSYWHFMASQAYFDQVEGEYQRKPWAGGSWIDPHEFDYVGIGKNYTFGENGNIGANGALYLYYTHKD